MKKSQTPMGTSNAISHSKTYAVVLGKHLDISRAELFARGLSITKHYGQVAVLDMPSLERVLDTYSRTHTSGNTEGIEKVFFSQLAGIVKWGEVIPSTTIFAHDIFGVSTRELGNYCKAQGLTKRYKEVDVLHTDQEIKEQGSEYVMLDASCLQVLHIQGYQDIEHFSCIDFDKPVNSMQIGMMPAKLTQILTNIAIGMVATHHTHIDMEDDLRQIEEDKTSIQEGKNAHDGISMLHDSKPYTVYDPFMGLGTTYMVANALGYNVIGSDINIAPAKQNLGWRKQQKYSHELPITLFQHDATQSLAKPFLQHVHCIVTEGWLGHIVTAKTSQIDIKQYSIEIEKLYKARVNNMVPLREHMIIVCTIPWHTSGENKHVTNILQHCEKKGINVKTVPQVYTRQGQKVGRKIVILQR